MELTTVEQIIITYLPTLVSILSIVSAISVFLSKLKNLATSSEIKAEKESLKEQNTMLREQFRKYQKTVALLIEKQTKVKYEDLTEVKNDKDLQN